MSLKNLREALSDARDALKGSRVEKIPADEAIEELKETISVIENCLTIEAPETSNLSDYDKIIEGLSILRSNDHMQVIGVRSGCIYAGPFEPELSNAENKRLSDLGWEIVNGFWTFNT
jgi:hypothetical protein